MKIVTLLSLLVTLLTPLVECFDRWDRPGFNNDTEFPVFLIMFFVTLVLFVVQAIARRTLDEQNDRIETEIVYPFVAAVFSAWSDILVPVVPSPPLRI